MPILAFLSSRLGIGLLASVLVAALGWAAYDHIFDAGFAECQRIHEKSAAQAADVARRQMMVEIAWGEQLSKELTIKERQLNETKREYLLYANSILGHCPAAVGVLSNAAASQSPAPTGKPDETGPPISAAALAGNIAENYARAHANAAQLNALIRWVEEVVK